MKPTPESSLRPSHAVAGALAIALLASGCVSLRPWSEATAGLAPGRLVDVAGQAVSVDARGPATSAAPPLVLLHGFGESTAVFDAVLPALAAHRRVVAIDLNGFGYTRRPRDPAAYTLAGQSRLVLGALDRLGIDRADFLGHSYGGAIALYLASRSPERVGRLVLVDNAMPIYASARRSSFFRWRWLTALAVRTTGLGDRRIRDGLLEAYHDDSKVDAALVRSYAERLRIEGATDAYRGLVGPSDESPVELDLATIPNETLVVWGRDDALIPVTGARERAARLPRGRFVEIPDCGHTPVEECPTEFLDAVGPFLASAVAAAR